MRPTQPGTISRSCDAQTRLEHTVAIAALVQAMAKELSEHFDQGYQLGTFPAELLDENKWLAARHGMHGELIDLPSSARVPAAELARRVVERLAPTRPSSARSASSRVIDLAERGTGATASSHSGARTAAWCHRAQPRPAAASRRARRGGRLGLARGPCPATSSVPPKDVSGRSSWQMAERDRQLAPTWITRGPI
jgi:hypothetical protein